MVLSFCNIHKTIKNKLVNITNSKAKQIQTNSNQIQTLISAGILVLV